MALYMQSPDVPPKKKRGYLYRMFVDPFAQAGRDIAGDFRQARTDIVEDIKRPKKIPAEKTKDVFRGLPEGVMAQPFLAPFASDDKRMASIMKYGQYPEREKALYAQEEYFRENPFMRSFEEELPITQIATNDQLVPATPLTRAPIDIARADRVISPPEFEREGLVDIEKEVIRNPDLPELTKETPLNMADLYKLGLDKAVKRGNLINLAEAGLNIGQLLRRYPESEKLETPEFETPRLQSPSRYVMQTQLDQMDLAGNAARKAMLESGRADLLTGLTATEIAERGKIAAGGAMMDVETMNKNIIAEAETKRVEAIAKVETDKYNIEKQIKENLMTGQTISQAINNLGEIGRQYVNRMTEAEFNKWYADILQEEMSLKRMGLI